MFRGKLFSVHALPNTAGKPRLGLSISKKVGTAVVRNGIRRRLKEIFHSAGDGLPGHLDLVISARPSAADASFQELREEFLRSVLKLDKEATSWGLDEAS